MTSESHAIHLTKVCLVGLDGPSSQALSYLITHVNELQRSLEFELVDVDENDALVRRLSTQQVIPADEEFETLIEGFAERQDAHSRSSEEAYGLPKSSATEYAIVSLARLSNNYYAWGAGRTSLLTLGGWDKSFAPPSLVEYALTLVIRFAAIDAFQGKRDTRHLGSKGCLFDFNPNLETVRFKVLNSFICGDCDAALAQVGGRQVADDLRLLLGKTWLGKADDPLAPAGICRKLGYDLFLTRGIRPGFFQGMILKLQDELPTEGLKFVFAILLGAALTFLGFKAGGK